MKWFALGFYSIEMSPGEYFGITREFLEFINKHGLKPGEFMVSEMRYLHNGSLGSIHVLYYAEKELSK